jgi:uncharacterized protein YkwD
MSRLSRAGWCAAWISSAGLAMASNAQADALLAVQVLRQGGCGGLMPAVAPLHHTVVLDRAAEQWAHGLALSAAAKAGGYPADVTAGLRVAGSDSDVIKMLRPSSCRTVSSRDLQDIGVYQRGPDSWLVLSAHHRLPDHSPAAAAAPALAVRALELINKARASGTRCGQRSFAPTSPLTLSTTLANVAFGHAADMAEHDYFEHQDLMGRSPAQRVRAVGYEEKLVGENIAYGPKSIEEVVQGWLDSPDHCENIMDPRFAEMGIAYAPGELSRRGLYWVQLLAAPRSVVGSASGTAKTYPR